MKTKRVYQLFAAMLMISASIFLFSGPATAQDQLPVTVLTDSIVSAPAAPVIPPVVDSAFVAHVLDSLLHHVGATPVTVFGIQTTWWVLVLSILIILEFVLRMIPGAEPVSVIIRKILNGDYLNRK